MQQIEQEVRQFVIENFVFESDDRGFSNDASFFDTGLIDSMGVLTLVEFVKDKYGVSVEDDELLPENWDSVNRIATFIRARLGRISAADRSAVQIA
jgi:acyl carrier protein